MDANYVMCENFHQSYISNLESGTHEAATIRCNQLIKMKLTCNINNKAFIPNFWG